MVVDLPRLSVELNVSNDDLAEGGTKPESPSASRHIRRKAIAFIDSNLSSPTLRPSTVAEGVHVSRAVLYRAFQIDGGVASFLHERRLNRAKSMLEERADEPGVVQEVAFACGYDNSNRFSRLFKSHFAEAPSQFVKRIRYPKRAGASDELSGRSENIAEARAFQRWI